MPVGAGATLGMFQGGSLVSIIQRMGQNYFSYLKQHGGHDRLLRRVQMLGRTADVYEVWPLYKGSSSSYGRELIWLDEQYPLVLRLELRGLGKYRDQPHHWIYRVTTLTFGQGPSAQALAYQPPVRPQSPPTSGTSSSGSGAAGPNARWHVPKGFIAAGTPAGYMLAGSGEEQDPMWNGPSSVEAVFTKAAAFVYIQEQVRVGGLPVALMTGTPRRAGRCKVWTGRYSAAGLHWLALQRGEVSLLAVSNSMSRPRLLRYTARKICQ